MRHTIRRDKSRTYNEQMADREADRQRSREHPASQLNDERQRQESLEARRRAALAKEASRAQRQRRRAEAHACTRWR